jgi:GNAT superfamily N-acetyltransferase
MEAIRVYEEWQKAAVHYVRAGVAFEELKIPFRYEFADDAADSKYIVVMEGEQPVSTCRIHLLDKTTGKIERVDTLKDYRHKNYAKAAILEAENWMREMGIQKVQISSRDEAVGFYEKVGYEIDQSAPIEQMGPFTCITVVKKL